MAALDWFFEGFGRLVEDIRHKVVEEPWFGRTVTPPAAAEPHAPSLAEALGWAQRGAEPGQTAQERKTHEHGIER